MLFKHYYLDSDESDEEMESDESGGESDEDSGEESDEESGEESGEEEEEEEEPKKNNKKSNKDKKDSDTKTPNNSLYEYSLNIAFSWEFLISSSTIFINVLLSLNLIFNINFYHYLF